MALHSTGQAERPYLFILLWFLFCFLWVSSLVWFGLVWFGLFGLLACLLVRLFLCVVLMCDGCWIYLEDIQDDSANRTSRAPSQKFCLAWPGRLVI